MKLNSDTPLLDELARLEAREDGGSATGLCPTGFSAAQVPAVLEYMPLNAREVWRVADFKAFVTEFDFAPWAVKHGGWEQAMMLFHEAASTGYSRGWMLTRRLFGITTLILPTDAPLEESKIFTRPELCAFQNLSKDELTAELQAVRTLTRREEQATPAPEVKAIPAAPQAELELDDALLRRHGFEESMFKVRIYRPAKKGEEPEADRPKEENDREREWFVRRVREWNKMLTEPFAHSTARDALLTDLYLHRLAIEMAPLSINSPRFDNLMAKKKELEGSYRVLRETLQEWFPTMNIAGRDAQSVSFSDIHKGWREYYATGDTKLFDRVRTVAEIELDSFQSVQNPEPAYRFGQTVYIIEAMHNLAKREWRSKLTPRLLRALDVGYHEGVDRARKEQGKPLVDMSKGVMRGEGGPNGDFPELGTE